MAKTSVEIESLTSQERLALIEQLWESLSKNPADIPVTAAQREELDRRIADLERNPSDVVPWEQVIDRIRSRK